MLGKYLYSVKDFFNIFIRFVVEMRNSNFFLEVISFVNKGIVYLFIIYYILVLFFFVDFLIVKECFRNLDFRGRDWRFFEIFYFSSLIVYVF